MTVSEFLENFVGHNSVINLYKKTKIADEEDKEFYRFKYTKIWSGMDWQCSNNTEDIEYLKKKEIEACPYKNYKVSQVKQFPHGDFSDEIDLIIEI